MLQTIRKRLNNKGFTLVELIVVLVILAILAALLIPSLTGYIDRARQESVVAETRMVVLAAQTVLSEEYGQNENFSAGEIVYEGAPASNPKGLKDEIHELSETKGHFRVKYSATAKVLEVTYDRDDYTCKYVCDEETGESSYVCPSPDDLNTTSLFGSSGDPDGSSSEFVFA